LSETLTEPTLSDAMLTIRESLGDRRFGPADFPLSVGGAGSALVLAGRPAGIEAYLGVHEDQLFVQPAEGAEVLHNGVPVRRSTWLRSGDVVNFGQARLRVSPLDERVIDVEDGSVGNITAPPIVPEAARVQGEGEGDTDVINAVSFRASGRVKTARSFTISGGRIAVIVAALVLAPVLWFIFSAQSVGITTQPTGASIEVFGGLPGVPLGGRILMRPGTYELRAEKAGYQPAQQKIVVTQAPNQTFALTLAKLPGILQVDVPAAATVTIDGKQVGDAPGKFPVAPGKHQIAIAAERYQPFTGEVDIEGLGKPQTFKPALVPGWADVTISSEPAGAEVLVSGEVRGVTPLKAEIMAGSRPVELRLAGFKPWTTDVQVKANEPFALGPVKLGLPDGRLTLRSDPAGASVSVGGVYRGQTPVNLELRPDISHAIVLTRAGFEPITRQVSLSAGESQALSLALTGIYGEITVRGQPADAQIYVDGKPSGTVNQTLRLVAATHDIEIRKAGFVDYKTSVTPRPGVAQVIETTLLTPEQSRIASTPATIRTKADQQMKLMPLGRFTMGSPRREPGRRANEAQRDVEFRRAFYMSTTEVTNAQFRRFKTEHRSGLIGPNSLDLENQPAVSITWQEAALFCNWLSEQDGLPPAYVKKGEALVPATPMTKGYRMPTDAEWEWVARYEGNGRLRRYAWGDALPVGPRSGNYADYSSRLVIQDIIPDYDDGYAASAPVAKFPANTLGLFDIGGNVAEWVHDYYAVSIDAAQTAIDPMGPAEGKQHGVRGASWRQSGATDLRLSARDFGENARNDLGFRIARYVE
jgi:formylglycine-generating enzyme required for sulfatase activity